MKNEKKKTYLISKVPKAMGILAVTKEWQRFSYDLISRFKDKKVIITIKEVDDETYEKFTSNHTITKFDK